MPGSLTKWLHQSQLKLNPQKTEVLWVGKRNSNKEIRLPHLDGTPQTISTTIKKLGVIFDASLSMEIQIAKVAHQAFYHSCQAKLLAPYLSSDDLATVIHATVTSRLDYCNSLYAGLPLNLTQKLQLVQNAAAWVLTKNPWKSHIRPILQPVTSGVPDQIQSPGFDL